MFLTLAHVECRQVHAPPTLLFVTQAVIGSVRQSRCEIEARFMLNLGYVWNRIILRCFLFFNVNMFVLEF